MPTRLQVPVALAISSPHAPSAHAKCRGGGKGYPVIGKGYPVNQVESTLQLAERTSKRPVTE